ncbi:MAG: peptidoglycan-associated lipoprotein [Myxococcota bacterium]|jgi:peptidoglycan-associated lipoprotein
MTSRLSLLLILMPLLFAAKCRKDKEVEDDGSDLIDVPPPEVALQVTAVEPGRPEAGKSFRATIYGSAFSDGAQVWVGPEEMNTVVFRDENTLVVSVPALTPGGYDVRVRNPDGASATLRAGVVVRTGATGIPNQCRSMRIGFDLDSHAINADARQTFSAASECFGLANVQYRVEGHADERGTTDYNLALGQRRADSVQRYLIGQGVTPSRISSVSYGEEKPLEYGANERAWTTNRRAEILVSE